MSRETPCGARGAMARASLLALPTELLTLVLARVDATTDHLACALACAGALYFGLRRGGGCGCADAFGRYGATEDAECDTPCTAEPTRMCGGAQRTSVYRRAGPHGVLVGAGAYFSYDLLRARLPAASLSSFQLEPGLKITLHAADGRPPCRPRRLQSFITRYRPLPGEASLPKHVDGISLDGSLVIGLPTSRPFAGGGLTVWEGNPDDPDASHFFPMHPGDACFLDRLVWHQANPVTAGERWAIVIFYKAK